MANLTEYCKRNFAQMSLHYLRHRLSQLSSPNISYIQRVLHIKSNAECDPWDFSGNSIAVWRYDNKLRKCEEIVQLLGIPSGWMMFLLFGCIVSHFL